MLRKLFKDTIIYGIATVLPRVLTLLLTRLYVNKLDTADFGIYSGCLSILSWGTYCYHTVWKQLSSAL